MGCLCRSQSCSVIGRALAISAGCGIGAGGLLFGLGSVRSVIGSVSVRRLNVMKRVAVVAMGAAMLAGAGVFGATALAQTTEPAAAQVPAAPAAQAPAAPAAQTPADRCAAGWKHQGYREGERSSSARRRRHGNQHADRKEVCDHHGCRRCVSDGRAAQRPLCGQVGVDRLCSRHAGGRSECGQRERRPAGADGGVQDGSRLARHSGACGSHDDSRASRRCRNTSARGDPRDCAQSRWGHPWRSYSRHGGQAGPHHADADGGERGQLRPDRRDCRGCNHNR